MTYGKRHAITLSLLLCMLAGVLLLAGCGSHSPDLQFSTSPISITLIPTFTALNPVTPVSVVTATVFDQDDKGVTWMVSPASFGTLSDETSTSQAGSHVTTASIKYTAPTDFSVPTTITITATSISNPQISSSVQIAASPVIVTVTSNSLTLASIPLAPQTLNPGEQIFFIAQTLNSGSQGVTWTISPVDGAGSLSNVQPTTVNYTAPTTVTEPIIANITATSVASSSAVSTIQVTVLPSNAGPNVTLAKVDGGPVVGRARANGAFTSVTICNPGSNQACQVIDGILIDTGSYGLRILQSAIPFLKLPKLVDNHGNTLQNCYSALDGAYLWGPVSRADVYIGGEAARGSLVQVISSSNAQVPDSCSNGGLINENTPELLGANGILGIGPEPTDCTVAGKNYCDGSVQLAAPNLYYSCPSAGCQLEDVGVAVSKSQQLTNPVTLFDQDKNGVILELLPVSGSQLSTQGLLTFGISTQINNQLGSATVFTADSNGHITTVYKGQTLTDSFLDSGSPALFFPDSFPTCNSSLAFFCPPAQVTGLSAVNQGATQGSGTVTFSVDNADTLFSTFPGYAVFSTLAGSQPATDCSSGGVACTFDWGMPFFYGRRVFVAIDGQEPPAGAPPTPWWAY